MAIKAVTFDFWNTLYSADGWAPDKIKPLRLATLAEALAACGKTVPEPELEAAWRTGFEAYLEAWRAGHSFGARQQVEHVLGQFDCRPDQEVVATATRRIEDASLVADLFPLPGLDEALGRLLDSGIRLGIISDTGLTPGRVLRGILKRDGLARYFTSASFSDETGFPKPNADMFLGTLAPLGVEPHEAVHVGDMPPTDIAGALDVGMWAVRFAGASDRDEPPPAHFVIRDHRELPPLLDRMEGRPHDGRSTGERAAQPAA